MSEATPFEWCDLNFGQLCQRIVNGGTPPTDVGIFWNGTMPWVTGADFTSKGIGHIRRFVSDAGIRASATSVVKAGNLLVVTRTGVGKLAIAPFDIAISQDISGIYIDGEKAVTNFVYHLLTRELEELKKLNQGTSINGIIRSDLERHVVRLPKCKSAQLHIAAILTSIDTAIEKTETLIAKYQQIKAGLMHDLFTRGVLPNGQLRPPREQAPELYQETVIGWIPRAWGVARLETILRKSGGHLQTGPFGSQLHAHEYQTEGIPVVMPQDINEGKIGTESIARISERRALSLAKHQLKIGDIIIARRGELSRAAAVSEDEQGWLCGTGCFLLRLGRTDLNHFFFSHIYRYDYIQRQIAGTQVGTTMPSLNNSVMGRVFFPCPTPNEQKEISNRLSNAEAEVNNLRNHAKKLKLQKLGLMQDLLTGKVQVKVHEPTPELLHA